MKRHWLIAVFLAAALPAQAASLEERWENLKLRAYPLIRFFSDQEQELGDIRAQGLDPQRYTRIDLADLVSGGPPKGGIPSLDAPRFETAGHTPFTDGEPIIGLVIGGDARAYPYGILNWHEIVNDTVGGVPVTVTYCPLCDTGIVFERGATTFGVSGKLYQSCLVMYDRATETLYAQPWGLGIVGRDVNRSLPRLPAVKTTLGAWRRLHPETKVLSANTGHRRDYFAYPYGTYDRDRRLLFPVRGQQQLTLHPKAIVSYVWSPAVATPVGRFAGASAWVDHRRLRESGELDIAFGKRSLKARWNPELETAEFFDANGARMPSSTAFAFVYPAFFMGARNGARDP